jgi:molybdopterin/thiamine biosynthesis adenylyltransferase
MDVDRLLQQEFSRNIGLLSEAEQRRLLQSHVAIAGAGGVGGLHVLTLARLGVGRFTIADPDTFEVVNVSRQFGALHSTLGRNKAEVLGEMVLDINPQAQVRVIPERVESGNLADFLAGAEVFVDGIDFFEIEARRVIFRRCREMGIYALTAAPLGFGATLQAFSPDGMSFDTYFGLRDGMEHIEQIAAFASGLAPRPYHIRYLDVTKVDLRRQTGPAVSPACTLASSLIATETVKVLTGNGRVRPVPCYLQFDMLLGRFVRGRVWLGGRNPLQRLKKWLIMKKARASLKGDAG